MRKRIFKVSFCTVFCLFCLFLGSLTTQAASVKTLKSSASKTFTVSADMNGDGKNDKIQVKFLKTSSTYTGIKVTMNGKKVLTEKNLYYYTVTAVYIKQSKNREFLQVFATGDSGMRSLNSLYRYDKTKKKFVEVLDLNESSGTGINVKSATSKTIKVYNSCMPSLTGRVYWYFTYEYKNGKFQLKSNTAAAKCIKYSYKWNDGYDSLFANSKFKAMKTLTLYTDTSLSTVAFTVSSGTVLQLKKVRVVDQDSSFKMYFQFKNGSNTGWMSYSVSGAFYGVSSRSAGGFYG